MTAAEILAIPGAKKHWSTTADVEVYIMQMAAVKAKYGGEDINSSV